MFKKIKFFTFNILFSFILLSCSFAPHQEFIDNNISPYRTLASRSNSCDINLKKIISRISWTEKEKKVAYDIILSGSEKVSRTVSNGLNLMSPQTTKEEDITKIAELNFRKALSFILDNINNLEINKDTAIKINRILTENLVPEEKRGNYLYRPTTPYPIKRSDPHILKGPEEFYHWLDSYEAAELSRNNPISFAEIIHNTLVALDSFPDGNGRLSRLFSDLALMKAGMPPALYSDMSEYFARGNALSNVSRSARIEYYESIVRNGRIMFNQKIKIRQY